MTAAARNDDLGMVALEELLYQRVRLYLSAMTDVEMCEREIAESLEGAMRALGRTGSVDRAGASSRAIAADLMSRCLRRLADDWTRGNPVVFAAPEEEAA